MYINYLPKDNIFVLKLKNIVSKLKADIDKSYKMIYIYCSGGAIYQ